MYSELTVVTEGGDMDINFVMFDPTGKVIFAELRKNSHAKTLNLTIPVYFSIRSADPMLIDEGIRFDLLKQDSFVGEHLETFRNSLRRIYATLENAQRHLYNKRNVESRDDSILILNSSRVRFWSTCVIMTVCIVAFVQVYLIQTLFDEHSRIGTVLRKNL
ncbi:hypothetical protein GJ496_005732 [Pomphorhynchus laevis]|nr:hypothetical protein GJ496_005732 [Pomphorhynchus laevis]